MVVEINTGFLDLWEIFTLICSDVFGEKIQELGDTVYGDIFRQELKNYNGFFCSTFSIPHLFTY